jgi:DNA repair protein RecO (recombination protein O)
MLHKTRGIVISYIKYKESSIIAKIYTDKFGIQTYIENGVRSAKGKNKIALFQALTLLDLVVYHDDKKEIHRISELKCSHPFQELPYEIRKSSIALFITEILSKTLKEHTENESLFNFLSESILMLDINEKGIENFHLIFLLKLSLYLGFSPENAQEIKQQFFDYAVQLHISNEDLDILNLILTSGYQNEISINRSHRNHLLEILLLYYRLHIEEFGEIKSLSVLKEVLG